MQELEKKLNYTFRNQELLREALNHSSYANEHRSQGLGSNERLEFLGDSVLGFVTAEYLFARHPDLPEAIGPPFWRMQPRLCSPPCIWTAALPPRRS